MYQLKRIFDSEIFIGTKYPTFENGEWDTGDGKFVDTNKDQYEPVEPARTWTTENIRSNLTLAEKVKWDSNTNPEIVTAKLEMATPQELTHTTAVIEMLVGANVISQASADKILS